MAVGSTQVTAAEIARLAGVTRATVSNWRRRHADFPLPTTGSEASPGYDLAAVQDWLAARGQTPVRDPSRDLRTLLRGYPPARTADLLLPLVAATAQWDTSRLSTVLDQPDRQLARTVRQLIEDIDPADRPARPDPPEGHDLVMLRATLRAVAATGPVPVGELLAHGAGTPPGWYQTPAAVAALMADLLARPAATGPAVGYPASVLDPACGSGTLLLAATHAGAESAAGNGTTQRPALYGQDRLVVQGGHTRVRLAAAGTTGQVRVGDSLRADAFAGLAVDAVLCTPPYGDRDWGADELAYDPRWAYGLPPRIESELAWVQHCLAHLAPGGRAVLLLPPAVADRTSGRRIRAELIRAGVLRAVVALPPRVVPPLHIGPHLWLLEAPAPGGPDRGQVLFVDTAIAGGDWDGVEAAVLQAWRRFAAAPGGFEPVTGVARVVPAIDLLDDTVDLTPARYCRTVPTPPDPATLAGNITGLRQRLAIVTAQLGDLVDTVAATPAAGSGSPAPAAGVAATAGPAWRQASVADLIRGGALTLLRAHSTDADRAVPLAPGDVILPETLGTAVPLARVAAAEDAGQPLGRRRLLLRPDPVRLDPWFLAGFLSDPANQQGATTGTTVTRLDPRRLRVPLMDLVEQRRYGTAFRHLAALHTAAALTASLVEQSTTALRTGLTSGALLPEPHVHSGRKKGTR